MRKTNKIVSKEKLSDFKQRRINYKELSIVFVIMFKMFANSTLKQK